MEFYKVFLKKEGKHFPLHSPSLTRKQAFTIALELAKQSYNVGYTVTDYKTSTLIFKQG